MKIDKDTLYNADFVAFEKQMTDEQRREVEDAAARNHSGKAGFYNMTIGDFMACMHGDFECIDKSGGLYVFDRYAVKAFERWLDDFTKACERLTLRPTPQQLKQSQGCLPFSFDEHIYVFCRNYFGLTSFDAVNTLTVGDFLLAKKDEYNKQMTERNIAQMMK